MTNTTAAVSSTAVFSVPEGGVDAIIAALSRRDPLLPRFVYERIDPLTREPVTTWIGLRVAADVVADPAKQFAALREARRAASDDGPLGGVFAFLGFPDAPEQRVPVPAASAGTPQAVFARLVELVRIDHAEGTGTVLQFGSAGPHTCSPAEWAELCAGAATPPVGTESLESTFDWAPVVTVEDFCAGAESFQRGAAAGGGDVHGVVLSVQLVSADRSDPVSSYRALRAANPSTCMFLLRDGDLALWGATSLSLVEIHDRRIVAETDGATHPIPEMPDGQTYHWDVSAKELSEYDVVADALWADVGGVAASGTQEFAREKEERVFFGLGHLFAEVQADIRPGLDEIDVVEALFPHGAAVGHPRAEALDLIGRLESVPRGPFAGAIGVFLNDGTTDVAAVTRSMWTTSQGSFAQAGAKVVPASVAGEEYEESVMKTLATRQTARPALR